MNSCTIPFVILRINGTAGCRIPVRPCTPTSDPPPALHTAALAQSGHRMTFDVSSSLAGATPAATPADAPAAIPAAPLAPTAPDPVLVANPVAGTGATAYPADLPPITSLSMLRS